MLGLDNVGPYMQAKQAHKFADWSEVLLDSEGKFGQEEMTRKFQVGLFLFDWALPVSDIYIRCFHSEAQRRCWQSQPTDSRRHRLLMLSDAICGEI